MILETYLSKQRFLINVMMASHLLLLEIGHVGLNFSKHVWLMRLSRGCMMGSNLLQLQYLAINAIGTTV